MDVSEATVEKIRSYSKSCQELEKDRNQAATHINYEEYNQQINRTLQSLREQVRSQEAALQDLRASNPIELPRPDSKPHERLAQTHRAIRAYKSLVETSPELPAPDSPLNGLLLFRETTRILSQLKRSVPATADQLARDIDRLKTEENNLRDAKAISMELQRRIKALKEEKGNDDGGTDPDQLAKEMIAQQRSKGVEVDEKTTQLKVALTDFINKYLASMIAAEDMGGPVVGDQTDVSDSTLEIGYTVRGKVRTSAKKRPSEDPRQQRIDHLVRRRSSRRKSSRTAAETENGEEEQEEEDMTRNLSPKEKAAKDIQTLIESLIDLASNSSSYLDLERDSAASRFLVKAKIAQFHPRDSRKLRLIDVAREIPS
ncbi:hypothetical protein FQN57_002651 [Myotisia sp. PD_48]|nr:hypothetical protein FQN57_002651 [Myotisia sp. PD_48]